MSNTTITNIADITETARVAANIEDAFNRELGYEHSADGKGVNELMVTQDGNEYKILAEYEFPNPEGDYQKAVALKNEISGEIYFHFNGTGDGNWGYNAAAYGAEPQPSVMQEGCASWFDKTYNELYALGEITDNSRINVTGHSQGGNNAMYVTMRAENADKINLCLPLDGPGFSDKFVSDTKQILGDDYYKQTGKIWAFNGEHDFVSILGQNSIVPEGHTKYVRYSKDDVSIMDFHCSGGLIDDDGHFVEVLNDDSPIRKRIASAVDKIKELPQEDQALTAKVIMAFCENVLGGDDEPRMAELSSDDFDRIKPALIPVLVELLAYNTEEITESLQYILGLDEETAQSITNLVIKFDSYPVEIREDILTEALELIKCENGKIEIDTSGIPRVLVEAFPMVVETMITNPADVWAVAQELGLDKIVGDWIKEHPWKTAGIVAITAITAPIWAPVAAGIVIDGLIIDLAIRIVQGITDIAVYIKDGILDFFESVKDTINKVKEWFHNNFNKGAKYVKEHPYFKADPDSLYNYAARLNNVNRRLSRLDRDMRSLYRQVGFLDLWDILVANLLTAESYYLSRAQTYLMNTAERLKTAEDNAKNYLEG